MDQHGNTVGAGAQASDVNTFSNVDPHTSDAEALGGDSSHLVWGTNISISDSMHAIKDFLSNFQKKYRMIQDGELQEGQQVPQEHPGATKEYVEMMKTMLDLGVTALNLDARNLKSYPPTRKLWHQLQAFPNEIIPMMDVAIKDVMAEIAEKRMNEMRMQQQQGQRPPRARDGSSLPPDPNSDADSPAAFPSDAAGGIAEVPDLVREVESKLYRVRTFGLDNTINLRELNPSGM